MPLVVKDRVKETSTTSGTGTLTLGGAATGFRSFADIGNGNTTYYAIVDTTAGTWEVGIGTYTSSGTTLARNTILSNSSGTTAAINFAANIKDVFVTYPSSKSLYYQDSGGVVISESSSSDALRITQAGAGNALVVEDSTNPDSTPFVIDTSGRAVIGATASQNSAYRLQSVGTNGGDLLTQRWAASTSGSFIRMGKSRGASVGTRSVVASGDTIASFVFEADDGTAFIQAAEIEAQVDGTPGTNDMPGRLVFSTTADGANAPTERMRIDSAGDVGIGTTSPTARLNVVDATSQDAVRITQTGSGNALVIEDSANPDSSPFVIDSSGNLLVGNTTSSSFYLPGFAVNYGAGIQGTGTFYSSGGSWMALSQWSASTSISGGAFLTLNKSNGTPGTHTIVNSGQRVGAIGFAGSDGVKFLGVADIYGEVDGTPGTNDMPGRLVFATTADGATTPTERVRIDSSGNVGIGATPSGLYKLQVNGDISGKEIAATNGLFINSNTVSESFTVPNNYNAMSSGAVTVSNGVTVTIPSNSRWVVV